MSRHLLLNRPNLQVVIGFDHPLVSFFGQVFDPSRDPGTAIGGWPTRIGLGTRRPVSTREQASRDLDLLFCWSGSVMPADVWNGATFAAQLSHLRTILFVEWSRGDDLPSPPLPADLQGVR